MGEKLIVKEELICMLTDIYDQLEELENVIEINLSTTREKLHVDYSARLIDCEDKIISLEVQSANFEASGKDNVKNNKNYRKSMKPELGVLLPINLR